MRRGERRQPLLALTPQLRGLCGNLLLKERTSWTFIFAKDEFELH